MNGEFYVYVVYDPRHTNTPIWVSEETGDACKVFLAKAGASE